MEYLTSRIIEKVLYYKEDSIPDVEYLLSDAVTEEIKEGNYPDIIPFVDFIDEMYNAYKSMINHRSILEFVNNATVKLIITNNIDHDLVETLVETFESFDYFALDVFIKSKDFEKLDVVERCLAFLQYSAESFIKSSRVHIISELKEAELSEIDREVIIHILDFSSREEAKAELSISESIYDSCYGHQYDIDSDVEILVRKLSLLKKEELN